MRGLWRVALATAVLLAIPGGAGVLPAAAAEGATLPLVEDFAYPGADSILAERGLRLISGDGHVLLADCGTPGPVESQSRTNDHVCFDISGAAGFIGLEIPETYLIRTDEHAIAATASIGSQQRRVDLQPNEWNGIGEGTGDGPATLLALDARPADGSDPTIPVDATRPFVGRLTVGQAGQVGSRGCTATLVSPWWVLSAASCFAGDIEHPVPLEPFAPSVAASVRFGGRAALPVTHVLPRADRDVVLAKLARPATGIEPVRLSVSAPAVSAPLSTSVYGRTGTVWPANTQTTSTVTVSEVRDTTLTGSTAAGAVCKGGVGGPMFDAGGLLVGVLTRAGQSGCLGSAATGTDGVATRVDNIAAWVGREAYPELPDPELNLAVRKAVSVSSAYDWEPWGAPNATDGQRASMSGVLGWSSSADHHLENHTESISVDLGGSRPVSRVDLFPRSDGGDAGYGFPVDFTVQLSEDGTNWVTVATRVGYGRPSPVAQLFPAGGRNARYVKVIGTSLPRYPTGKYYMQLAETEIW